MVNVTWITPYAPDRSGGGGQIRQAHLLLALAKCARIELICAQPVVDPDVRAAVARVVEVQPVAADWRDRHPWRRRVADLGAALVPLQPMEVRALRPVRSALRPALAANHADVVLVEFAGLAPLLGPMRSGWGRPRGRDRPPGVWVLTLHNLPSRMSAQQASIMPHRRQRWLLRHDAAAAARFERRAVAAYDAVITCADEDAAALAAEAPGGVQAPSGVRAIVVANGTDTDQFQPTPLPGTARVVFTGALYTTPNVDAARWFCLEVLPLIRREEPSVVVDLVGARPVGEVRALGQLAGVTVHADVATVAPYLQAARVAVVPVRVGSGTRLKVLDALAAGRPVVGTTIGLEGLHLRPGEHVLVADDPAAFAEAVVRLLRDDHLATALADAGRAEVEARFGWPAIAAGFTQSVLALARPDAPPPPPSKEGKDRGER